MISYDIQYDIVSNIIYDMCACLWRFKALTLASLTFSTSLTEAGQFANEDGQLWQVCVNSVPWVPPLPLDDSRGCLASWHLSTFQGSKLWTTFLLDKHSIHWLTSPAPKHLWIFPKIFLPNLNTQTKMCELKVKVIPKNYQEWKIELYK